MAEANLSIIRIKKGLGETCVNLAQLKASKQIKLPKTAALPRKRMNELVEVKHDTSCMKDRKHSSIQRYWRGKWGSDHVAFEVKCKAN